MSLMLYAYDYSTLINPRSNTGQIGCNLTEADVQGIGRGEQLLQGT